MKGRLLLDIVIGEGATIFKLLAGEDQALLVGGDALLVLNLGLDVVDGVGGLDLEGNGLAREGLNEDLHSTAETEDQVEGRLLLDVIVREGTAVFELLASEDETLLVGRDAFLVLDLGLDIIDGVRGLDLEGDGLSGERLNEDLHGDIREKFVEEVVVDDREVEAGEDEGQLIRFLIQTPPAVTKKSVAAQPN